MEEYLIPTVENIARLAIRVMSTTPPPNSCDSLDPNDLNTIRLVCTRVGLLTTQATRIQSNSADLCRLFSEAWGPVFSWTEFLIDFVEPQGFHDLSKEACAFVATSFFHLLCRTFYQSKPLERWDRILPSLLKLLKLIWKPCNVSHALQGLIDVSSGRSVVCPFVISGLLLQYSDARMELSRAIDIASISTDDFVEGFKDRLCFLQSALVDGSGSSGVLRPKEVIRLLQSVLAVATQLSKDARLRRALLQCNVFTIGARVAVDTLERGCVLDPPFGSDRKSQLSRSALSSLFETTFPLPHQLETLGQLIEGGLVKLIPLSLSFPAAEGNASAIHTAEFVLKHISSHTSHDAVSVPLHRFLDENDVYFDNTLEQGDMFTWHLYQSYSAAHDDNSETYLLPSCSFVKCSEHFSNGGGRAILPCVACKKVAYCSDQCTIEDWNLVHESECDEAAKMTEEDEVEGRSLSFASLEAFLWIVRNLSENFTHLLFPGDANFIGTQNSEVTHCDMRRVPIHFDHFTFVSYIEFRAFYIPSYLRLRRSFYIIQARLDHSLSCRAVDILGLSTF
ncbi:hypothetical protein D9611_000669 [Ephemerocybe angulata]|uniref:MYND-type domain-containing protein n=1 Tax=Ephemerocybe angulata TaxID=980116 RepID=A0A8H5BMB0_9AGAR|nr:hypothetical protein D9611_000669 [Tulosesus angulatus]